MAVIKAKKVTKRFDGFTALADIDLSIESGEFFGCFGPNGAGKTTLLKILTGQIVQTAGAAEVLGCDVKREPIEIKRKIGIVPEFESPPSFLTGREYLYFVGKVRHVDDLERKIEAWLAFFELTNKEGTICKDMSKGMRQKLMLAAAFIHDPDLLFLDEPFINLDPIFQKRVRDRLLEYIDVGRTIFMATHILEIAEKLCSRVAIIHNGHIVARGRIDELKTHASDDLEKIFMRVVENDTTVQAP